MSCWSLLRSRLIICLHILEPTELALMTKSRKSSIVKDRCINGTKRNSTQYLLLASPLPTAADVYMYEMNTFFLQSLIHV